MTSFLKKIKSRNFVVSVILNFVTITILHYLHFKIAQTVLLPCDLILIQNALEDYLACLSILSAKRCSKFFNGVILIRTTVATALARWLVIPCLCCNGLVCLTILLKLLIVINSLLCTVAATTQKKMDQQQSQSELQQQELPLEKTWTIQLFEDKDNIKTLTSDIKTISDFWRAINNLWKPSEILDAYNNGNYGRTSSGFNIIFSSVNAPLDSKSDTHKNGGKWVISIETAWHALSLGGRPAHSTSCSSNPNDSSSSNSLTSSNVSTTNANSDTPRSYIDIVTEGLYMLLAGGSESILDNCHGLIINCRYKFHRINIWVGSGAEPLTKEFLTKQGLFLRRFFRIPPSIALEFKLHSDIAKGDATYMTPSWVTV